MLKNKQTYFVVYLILGLWVTTGWSADWEFNDGFETVQGVPPGYGGDQGTILWDSGGYESDAATPDGTGDYDPADHVIGTRDPASTHITEDVETSLQVFNTDSVSWAPDAAVGSGSNYLKLSTGSATAMEELWIGTTAETFHHSFKTYTRPNYGEFRVQYGKRISSSTNVGALGLKIEGGASGGTI